MPLRGEGRCACAPHAHAPNRGGRRGNFLGNQLRSPVLPLSPQCAASPGILLSSSEMTKRSATAQPGHRLPSRCFLRLPEGRCERSRVFCCMGWAGYGPSSPLRGAAVPCAIGDAEAWPQCYLSHPWGLPAWLPAPNGRGGSRGLASHPRSLPCCLQDPSCRDGSWRASPSTAAGPGWGCPLAMRGVPGPVLPPERKISLL